MGDKGIGMKATIIVGEPCTGKSTIMKRLIAEGCFAYRADQGMPRHEDPLDSIVVFGRYDEEHQFPGTDRLHMGIKPVAMEHAWAYGHRGWHVVWEGARLGHGKTIEDMQAMGFDVRLGVTITDGPELMARRALERTQPESMLKRQGTLVKNLVERFAPIVTLLRCDEPAHAADHVRWIRGY
jgi:hypothetical protein